MRTPFLKSLIASLFTILSLCLPAGYGIGLAAEKAPPPAVYWMDAATENQSIPGMSDMSGMEGMFGRMAGMPQAGPRKTLWLKLSSPRPLPAEPEALHDIPPGQKMGPQLPLLIPPAPKYTETDEEPVQYEKPRVRMLIYWGCGDAVRKGQPRVLDTEKMSPAEFGKAFTVRTPSRQYPPRPRKGWVYSDWPNRKDSMPVPNDSSLAGSHLVHGNYTPDIPFAIDSGHDFMAPVEFSSVTGGLADSIRFVWRDIPTAIGYMAQAMAQNEKTGETIFWSSSELPDAGLGLIDYLTPADVRRFIKDKVIMNPDTTSCSIPKGIFNGAEGAILQFIGYGEELNHAYPPRPKDPKAPWNPIWTMKLRLKSTGFLPLGMEGMEAEQPSRQSGASEDAPRPAEEKDSTGETIRTIRGIFGF